MVERALWIISMLLIKLLYIPLNRRKIKSYVWKWPFDKYIPFIPIFIIPYLIFYPIFYIGGIFIAGGMPIQSLRIYGASFLINAITAFIFFYYFPTSVEEFIVKGKGFFEKKIFQLYQYDARLNAFPSIHVSTSFLTLFFLSQWFPNIAWFLWIVTGLIILSTLTIRQHHLPDIFGGVITSIIAIIIGHKIF